MYTHNKTGPAQYCDWVIFWYMNFPGSYTQTVPTVTRQEILIRSALAIKKVFLLVARIICWFVIFYEIT